MYIEEINGIEWYIQGGFIISSFKLSRGRNLISRIYKSNNCNRARILIKVLSQKRSAGIINEHIPAQRNQGLSIVTPSCIPSFSFQSIIKLSMFLNQSQRTRYHSGEILSSTHCDSTPEGSTSCDMRSKHWAECTVWSIQLPPCIWSVLGSQSSRTHWCTLWWAYASGHTGAWC